MPALKQLLHLIKHIIKQTTNRADRSKVISDIHKSCDIYKLFMSSLISCHQAAVKKSIEMGAALHPSLIVDSQYTHQEVGSDINYITTKLQPILFADDNSIDYYSHISICWSCPFIYYLTLHCK